MTVPYYNSLIDRDLLKKSEDYEHLPELYIIFVTDGDYFEKRKQVYNIVRKVEETGEVYKDKVHIVGVQSVHLIKEYCQWRRSRSS